MRHSTDLSQPGNLQTPPRFQQRLGWRGTGRRGTGPLVTQIPRPEGTVLIILPDLLHSTGQRLALQ